MKGIIQETECTENTLRSSSLRKFFVLTILLVQVHVCDYDKIIALTDLHNRNMLVSYR